MTNLPIYSLRGLQNHRLVNGRSCWLEQSS